MATPGLSGLRSSMDRPVRREARDGGASGQPWTAWCRPNGPGVQVTLLTRSGPFVSIGVAPNLLNVAAALMQELIKRANASKAGSDVASASAPEGS